MTYLLNSLTYQGSNPLLFSPKRNKHFSLVFDLPPFDGRAGPNVCRLPGTSAQRNMLPNRPSRFSTRGWVIRCVCCSWRFEHSLAQYCNHKEHSTEACVDTCRFSWMSSRRRSWIRLSKRRTWLLQRASTTSPNNSRRLAPDALSMSHRSLAA